MAGTLYKALLGQHACLPRLKEVLGVTNFGRTRDGWVEKDLHGELRIVIITRNGGTNRARYMADYSNHPYFQGDADWHFDDTYAFLYFKVPHEHHIELSQLAYPEPVDLEAKWQAAHQEFQMGTGEIYQRVLQYMLPTLTKMREAQERGEDCNITVADDDCDHIIDGVTHGVRMDYKL